MCFSGKVRERTKKKFKTFAPQVIDLYYWKLLLSLTLSPFFYFLLLLPQTLYIYIYFSFISYNNTVFLFVLHPFYLLHLFHSLSDTLSFSFHLSLSFSFYLTHFLSLSISHFCPHNFGWMHRNNLLLIEAACPHCKK